MPDSFILFNEIVPMCLIVVAWQPDHQYPLIVAANRDEFYARPALPLAQWPDHPDIYAGRDLKAGGTWLGITPARRFAALTNIRNMSLWRDHAYQSRGQLVKDYLCGNSSPEHYLHQVAAQREQYAGFNLIIGDARTMWHYNLLSHSPVMLEPGIHGISNADLDTPWPKVIHAKRAIQEMHNQPDSGKILAMLGNHQRYPDMELPDTGIPIERERALSSIFIASPDYGTRASTVIIADRSQIRITEKRFGPEGFTGTSRITLDAV